MNNNYFNNNPFMNNRNNPGYMYNNQGFYNGNNYNPYNQLMNQPTNNGGVKKSVIALLIVIIIAAIAIIAAVNLKKEETFKVTINYGDGSNVVVKQVKSNGRVAAPIAPRREGYVFAGWYDGDEIFDFDKPIEKDVVITAKWIQDEFGGQYTTDDSNKKVYIVYFDTHGGNETIESQKVIEGGVATRPENPTREGYTFVDWYYNGNLYDFNTPVKETTYLTAHWEKIGQIETYTVKFDLNGGNGSIADQTVSDGGRVTQPGNPHRSGYTFLGWYSGDKLFDFDNAIHNNMTLVAKWSSNSSGKETKYTIRFDLNGGNGNISNQSIVSGGKVSQPSNPTRSGYTFAGWYNGDNKYDFNEPVKKNFTLTAKWIRVTSYVVTFNSNGGSSVASQSVVSGGKATQPSNPTRSGYTFGGWYNGNIKYDFNTAVTADLTLTAKWTQNHTTTTTTYTVTFNSNGGSSVASQTVNGGGKATQPSNPTRSGYTFAGWYNGSTKYNFNNAVTSNITLTAHWTQNQQAVTVPTISYSKKDSGKWVFINNPEAVRDAFLTDNSNRLFYRDSFSGNMEIYYSHSYGGLSSAAYYVIRFYNPGSSNVTLTINKSGAAVGDSAWTQTWKSYYSGTNVTRNTSGNIINKVTIAPDTVVYFYQNGNGFVVGAPSAAEAKATKMKKSFDGVLNVTASGTLDFAALGYQTTYYNTVTNKSYPGNVEYASGIYQCSVYTGSYNTLPIVSSSPTFEINDTVTKGSKLKVKYGGSTYNSWLTNGTGAYLVKSGSSYVLKTVDGVYKNDLLNFSFKDASGKTRTVGAYPSYVDNRGCITSQYNLTSRNYNIANWGVHYKENITIKNTGTKARTVSFIIKNASNIMSTSGGDSTLAIISSKEKIYGRISPGSELVAWMVQINPGQTVSIPTEITLGNASYAYIEKYINVDI